MIDQHQDIDRVRHQGEQALTRLSTRRTDDPWLRAIRGSDAKPIEHTFRPS